MGADKKYSIGEVARMLELKQSALRFWEKKFPQIEPLHTKKGHRVYTEKHIAMLRQIQQLLHGQGMTIDGARRVLEESAAPVPDPPLMRMLTDELLAIRKLLASHGQQ